MNKRKSNSVNLRKMPEDSVSEITELEKEEILTRYYDAVLTPKQKERIERKKTQARLVTTDHVCSRKVCPLHKPKSP
jgi:HEPN domain-containing protein